MQSKCDKGKPCGNTCIESGDACTIKAGTEAASALDSAVAGLKLIAEGNYGSVYKKGNTIIKISKEAGKGIGANEAALQTEAHELGIAPKVHEATENMLAIEGWLPEQGWRAGKNYKPIKSINDAERESITSQLQALHANGIAHADAHSGNIFINRKAGQTGFIDYGLSVDKSHPEFISKVIQDIGKAGSAIQGFTEGTPLAEAHAIMKANKPTTKAGKLARFAAVQKYLQNIAK